jgi:hypothetical protein
MTRVFDIERLFRDVLQTRLSLWFCGLVCYIGYQVPSLQKVQVLVLCIQVSAALQHFLPCKLLPPILNLLLSLLVILQHSNHAPDPLPQLVQL